MMIYYVLVYPCLTYGNIIWGNIYETNLTKLHKVQKKDIRLMMFSTYCENSKPLYQKLQVLNVSQLYNFLACLFMYNYRDKKIAIEF